MLKEFPCGMFNTYFVNLDRFQKASNDDSFLFSKQMRALVDELILSSPKIPEETDEAIVSFPLIGGIK